MSLCKRRGFVFPGSEIYGGLANSWDFGPLGTELFNNISSLWWKKFVTERGDVVGVRGPIIMNSKVWEASGHLQNFTDPLVECKICHSRFRADHEDELSMHASTHKDTPTTWTDPKNFNLLFKTFLGTVESEQSVAYLRGELAQTMFTDFKIIASAGRYKLPFGIAQIGKAFRNEITTGNMIFRTKEFTIAEIEYFVKPGNEEKAFSSWLDFMDNFLIKEIGLASENLKHYEHPAESLAHYSKGTTDILYKFPWDWSELWGLASRTDFDLKNHEKLSGENLKYRDAETNEEYWPYVVEPTGGLERLMLAVILDAYKEYPGGRKGTDQKVEGGTGEDAGVETVLHLKPQLAPFKVAVLPLSKKEELSSIAEPLAAQLRKHFATDYDETQSIGKRYRRQDEIGTPWCVTVDFETPQDNKVTVRDRDTMAQERIAISELAEHILKKLG